MPYQKNAGMASGKGTKSGFRTDAAISNSRLAERTLQPWVPDSADILDGSLEGSSNSGPWDQFAENERRFGIKTDYDETIYTTTIDKSHPQYRERMAAADRKAREIERSQPTTAHVAEERVMDFTGAADDGTNEEDKYSGVRRQDFPPLTSREKKYTPPPKRAPSAQATVSGAPVDPAIISSQIRTTGKKTSPAKFEEAKSSPQALTKPASREDGPTMSAETNSAPQQQSKSQTDKDTGKPAPESKAPEAKADDTKSAENAATPMRPSAPSGRNPSPQVKEGTPSAASTVERDVLNSFKHFATQQRQTADKMRSSKAKADKEVKLTELKKFANSFKLSTPVPNDLISIIAKEPSKQKEIQAKALVNAEEMARTKSSQPGTKDKEQASNDTSGKAGTGASEARPNPRPPAPSQYTSSSGSGAPGRPPHARQSYAAPSHHNQFRNGPPHMGPQKPPLSQRLRNVEHHKMSQPPAQPHTTGPEMRMPPTGPASNTESSYGRRLSGVPSHMGAKLNPNSMEFRPNPSASSFNPSGGHPSASSSPRSAVANNAVESQSNAIHTGQAIRRKTKAIDAKKCFILSNVKTFQAPQGRNWDENDGLRPSYDTLPTWRQIQDSEDEKANSTMRLTYKEYLDQQSFAPPLSTPNQPLANSTAHNYQLPLRMPHNTHAAGPRHSPNMPSMPLHNQHGHMPHAPYNGMDEQRMAHSNSSQSYASPRMTQQVPMPYNVAMNSPGQANYNQPMMSTFVGPGNPQIGGQFRSFSNNHQQYLQHQPAQMGGPAMMPPQFVQPGMVSAPHMGMYGGHPPFAPPSAAAPPQPNGYPSPGRASAPGMAHQGSQQGQSVYGMSPNPQYQQPVFPSQQPGGQGARAYNSPAPQHFGTSPQQQAPPYGSQQHRGGSNYGGKNHGNHSQQPGPQQGLATATNTQARPDGQAEAK